MGGGGISLFPLLAANSLQVPHFSTGVVKKNVQFYRDVDEQACFLQTPGDWPRRIFH